MQVASPASVDGAMVSLSAASSQEQRTATVVLSRSLTGCWYSPPLQTDRPNPDSAPKSPSRVKGRRPNTVSMYDDLAFRRGVEIGVRRDGQTEIARQALAALHDGQEALDVRGYGHRYPTGQHGLEMSPRQPVLPFEEEHPRQFQAHPYQVRTVHQDGTEGLRGLVLEFASLGVVISPLGQLKGRHAEVEQTGSRFVCCANLLFLGNGSRQHKARQ